MSKAAQWLAAVAVGALAIVALAVWWRSPPAGPNLPPDGAVPLPPPYVSSLKRAAAELSGVDSDRVLGSVRFDELEEGGRTIRVSYQLEGLPPGRHVLSLHELGDCSSRESFGAVLEVDGGEEPAGVLGELRANVKGRARGQLYSQRLSLRAAAGHVVGHALVLHEGDAAGPAIGCAVVRKR